MRKVTRSFFWGMFISFLGSLPMGTLNVTSMQISIQESIQFAYYFSLGVICVEMFYVRISLIAINWIRRQVKLMRIMQWLTVAVMVALAIGCFIAALNPDPSTKNVVLQNNLHRFLLGMMMSAINPVQIPFWFGWSTVMFEKGVLYSKSHVLNTYMIGVGLGTLASHSIFIYGGNYMADRIKNSNEYLNWAIGGFFTIAACVQLYKIFTGKSAMNKFEEETTPY